MDQKNNSKQVYQKNLKANKKYIKNKTINKEIPFYTKLEDDVCIKVTNAWKIVANKDKRYELIKGVSCEVFKNKFLMIFGESGSGKTTFLSILSALDRPSEGNVNILGHNTACLTNQKLTKLRNEYIGYIFQQYGLLKEVSVIENIIVVLSTKQQNKFLRLNKQLVKYENHVHKYNHHKLANFILNYVEKKLLTNIFLNSILYYSYVNFFSLKPKTILIHLYDLNSQKIWINFISFIADQIFGDEFIYSILKKLEINTLINSNVNSLSGGQQQRVSIARAIAKKPQILFADEPTGAVDSKTAKCIMQLFLDLINDYKMTIIMVTHNHNLINLSDRYMILENGRIIKEVANELKSSIDLINFE